LKTIPAWVTWRYELSEKEKWTKVPYQQDGKTHAKTTDPETWTSFERVIGRYEHGRLCAPCTEVDGIGFVLGGHGIVGVDLDHCYNPKTKSFEQWATKIIARLNSYTEASPSGTGVRILLKGKLPTGGRKKGNIEIYSTGRYLTITGRVLQNNCSIESRQAEIDAFLQEHFPPEAKPKSNSAVDGNGAWHPSDDELLQRAFAAKNGDKLKRLFEGDTSKYPSQSEADLGLCSLFAFWAADEAQLDRLFRRSGLMRDKWDEKHGDTTYGERTISKAWANRTEYYEPHPQRQRFRGTDNRKTQ